MSPVPTAKEELADLTREPAWWRTAPIDALVVLALLGLGNWFLGPDDPGWQRLNPTPWVLLPLFLGGRYGTGPGLAGAALATGAILGLQALLGNMSPQAIFTTRPYFFLSLLVAAAAGSLVHHLVGGASERLRRRAIRLNEDSQRLREENDLLRVQQADLQASLLTHGAETLALPTRLQGVLSGDPASFGTRLLHLLASECGVTTAALYEPDPGTPSRWSRIATTAPEGSASLPRSLDLSHSSLVEAAIQTGETATWRDDRSGGPLLAAIPWLPGLPGNRNATPALLLIERLAFEAIHWNNLARIEAIFRWSFARRPAGASGDPDLSHEPSNPPILPREEFATALAAARDLESRWNLPGKLILFATSPGDPTTPLENLGMQVAALGRGQAIIGVVGDGQSIPPTLGLVTAAPTIEAAHEEARELVRRSGSVPGGIHCHTLNLEEGVALVQRTLPTSSPASPTQAHAAAPPMEPSAHREPESSATSVPG